MREDRSGNIGTAQRPAAMLDWRYAMCPLDTAADRFGPFEDLVLLWKDRAGAERRLPRRIDFEMADFRAWLGRIFIAKVERDPFNIRFTLWGTELTEWWRVDYTHETLGSLSLDPDLWKSSELRYFQKMDQAPFFGIASGRLTQHDQPYIKVLAVDLPLVEGSRMTHVVSAHMKIDLNDDIETLLPGGPYRIFEE